MSDNQTPCVPEIKAPCVSGNQASIVPDKQVTCVMEKIDTESAGSAHLPISESLPRKSTGKVSSTNVTRMIIFLLEHRRVRSCINMNSCQVAHMGDPVSQLTITENQARMARSSFGSR